MYDLAEPDRPNAVEDTPLVDRRLNCLLAPRSPLSRSLGGRSPWRTTQPEATTKNVAREEVDSSVVGGERSSSVVAAASE